MNDEHSVTAEKGYWAIAPMQCWKCHESTAVTTLLALPPILTRDPDDGSLKEASDPAYLSYRVGLSPLLVEQLKTLSPKLFEDASQSAASAYWVNHCERCGALIDDHYVHAAEGPLMPFYDEAAAARIELVPTATSIRLASASEVCSAFLDELVEARRLL